MSTCEVDDVLSDLLLCACEEGLLETVKFLLKKNIKISKYYVLSCAARSGNLQLINYLYHTYYKRYNSDEEELREYIYESKNNETADFFRFEIKTNTH